ncbi:MAG: HEPN domain-containing protein [Candidatus Cloacimonetes bacterium]|nr:HEPN domain-containing protein [Candidatus Cloacimonadota bacterium]
MDTPIVYTKQEAEEAIKLAEEIYNFVKAKVTT